MRKVLRSRTFLMSFFCTVLVLLFVFGMLMVDAEGRRLSFNDNAPPAEMLYQAGRGNSSVDCSLVGDPIRGSPKKGGAF